MGGGGGVVRYEGVWCWYGPVCVGGGLGVCVWICGFLQELSVLCEPEYALF